MKKLQFWLGLGLVAVLVFVALLSFIWTPYDPQRVVPGAELLSPSLAHPLGTDGFGIDILSRIMAGAKICLLVGIFAVGVAILVGVPIGIISGYFGGIFDEIIMRLTDIAYAFPALLLAILFAGVLGPSTVSAMLAIGLATAPVFIRITRIGALQVMSQDYILAAYASGSSFTTIALKHILRNVAALIGVQASISFAMAILAEAGLSYLGLGTPPPTPTWGRMLYESQNYIFNAPIQTLWPGLAIVLSVLGFNLLGDAMRDFLDPKLKEVA